MRPSVSAFGFRVASYLKHFNVTLPDGLALECLGYFYGLKVLRFAPMKAANRIL
jgi:hypothetical protein